MKGSFLFTGWRTFRTGIEEDEMISSLYRCKSKAQVAEVICPKQASWNATHCDVNSRKFNIRLLALYQLNNHHIEVWSLKTFLLKYTFKSLSPPLLTHLLMTWEKTVISMPSLMHVGQRQSLNKSLGCVLYHPLLLWPFSPWYLTDIKCKE